MTSLASRIKFIEKMAIDNSPTLLTALGVAGTITTAYLTHKATVRATNKLIVLDERARYDKEPPLTAKEVFHATWTLYIPPVVAGGMTIGSIVMANRIGTKRAAALAAAYTISEKAYSDYREKVIEKIGEAKETKVRDEIAQDQVTNNPPGEHNIVIVGTGDVLCTELYTGRYFRSSVEEIKKAVNDTNYQINSQHYASVSDFYDRLGLKHTQTSDEMGWTADKLMDVDITGTIAEDGQPCIAFSFVTGPVRDHHRFH